MEEEIYILGSTLLESPRCPLCDRRDAPDEESLRESARLLWLVWKSKDTSEAREDQQHTKGRDGKNPERFQGGAASYALTKEEKEIFFEALSIIKVPSGFSSNIKGIINVAEKKFQNLKSHDCHVLMTQLLPIALRGILPENV